MGRWTPGSERSTRSRRSADSSAPDSMATRRASICDSTCARSSFRPAPTARFSSTVAGFSQLSVICVSTPDLRPSQASRNCFQEDSSRADAHSSSKRPRRSANKGASSSGLVIPRWTRGRPVLFSGVLIFVFTARDFVPCAGKSLGDSSYKPEGSEDSALRYRSCSPSSRLCRFFLGRRGGGLGLLRQLGEGSGVEHGHIGQDLAVETYAGSFQAVNELTVGQAIQACGGTDALNPKIAIFAFFDATITEGIAIGAIGSFLRGLVELALGEKEAFCALEIFLTTSAAFRAAFYACHGFLLFCWRDKLDAIDRRKAGRRSGFVSDHAGRSKDPPLHRPAGTREALPGTICRACAPRCCASTLKRAEDCAENQRKNLAVRKHLPN